MAFIFQRQQHFGQVAPLNPIYTAEVPVTLSGSEFYCNLAFLLSFIHFWQFGWNTLRDMVYFPAYRCQNEQRCTWRSEAQLVEKRLSKLWLREPTMRTCVLIRSVSEDWRSIARYMTNPKSECAQMCTHIAS